MINKLFTFIVACFLIYALINRSNDIIPKFQELPKEQKNELVDKLKSYAEILTADPHNSLSGKESPIISENTETITHVSPQTYNPNTEPPVPNKDKAELNKFPKAEQHSNPKVSDAQNKIYNFLYNILHTEKGQELLNKILFTPAVVDKNNDASSLKNQSPYQNNSILNVLEGEGTPVECGDTVTVSYTTRLVSGQVIENTKIPKTFQVGNKDVIKGIEYALIGMKKGGIRRLIVPPRLAYIETKFSKNLVAGNEFITIDLELKDLEPIHLNEKAQLKIFDDSKNDQAHIIACSNPVYFTYKISDATGKEIITSPGIVSFVLGSKSVPNVINKIFNNIMSHSRRTAMLSSNLLYNKEVSFLPKNFQFPKEQMLIFEINTGYRENNQNNLNNQ